MDKKGLYDNINAKRMRIKQGSGEKMRKPGSKGAPTAANFKQAAKKAAPTAKKAAKKVTPTAKRVAKKVTPIAKRVAKKAKKS
jgi:cysteine sulfinate desulfinase/cysteine desulfurase-like protein